MGRGVMASMRPSEGFGGGSSPPGPVVDALWCNGSTHDFGSWSPGPNPGGAIQPLVSSSPGILGFTGNQKTPRLRRVLAQ